MIRLGTRGSSLSRTQSEQFANGLRDYGFEVELVIIKTEGDLSNKPLTEFGSLGVFSARIRTALLNNHCDLAVHSYKDLPTALTPGLEIAAVTPRESVADVLIARNELYLAELPPGSRVGTGSPRRKAQLLAARPDLVCVDIRGNVGTRLGYVFDGKLDAVIVAEAGLVRLGKQHLINERLDFLPAPAQGALAIEARRGTSNAGNKLAWALNRLDHWPSHGAVLAERSVLATLQAGCAAPVGAHAVQTDVGWKIDALVASTDGQKMVRKQATGPNPVALGQQVAEELLAAGAAEITDLQANKLRR